jgi:hypothetical protein
VLKAVFGRYFGGQPGTKKKFEGKKKKNSADFGRKNTIFEAMQPFIVFSESLHLFPAFAVVSHSRRNKIASLETEMSPRRAQTPTQCLPPRLHFCVLQRC